MSDRNVITGDPEMDEPGDWCDDCDGVDHHFPWCERDDDSPETSV